VLAALRLGYRHLDCAQLYKNERIVGRAIARALAEGAPATRAELFVTGKLAPTQMQAESVRPAIERSLACEWRRVRQRGGHRISPRGYHTTTYVPYKRSLWVSGGIARMVLRSALVSGSSHSAASAWVRGN
jgi:hypothetical protein